MGERRHLPVLKDDGAGDDQPRSRLYVFLVSATVILLTWTMLAALLNGVIAIGAHAGPVVVSLANLVVLFASAALGGVVARVLDPRAASKVARFAGAAAALLGWIVSFAWRVAGEARDASAIVVWLAVLAVMALAAGGGADVGRRLTVSLAKT